MNARPPLERRAVIVGALWLAGWSALTALCAWSLATPWPYVGSSLQLLLIISVAGILFRSFGLLRLWRGREQAKGWRRWLARFAIFIAGAVAAGVLGDVLETASMSRFEAAIAPFVKAVQANVAAPCPPAARYVVDAPLREYLDSAGFPSPRATIHFDGKRFVLAFPGGSGDIDGSTIWYDSAAPGWQKFHNDSRDKVEALSALVKGMQTCKFHLASGSQP